MYPWSNYLNSPNTPPTPPAQPNLLTALERPRLQLFLWRLREQGQIDVAQLRQRRGVTPAWLAIAEASEP